MACSNDIEGLLERLRDSVARSGVETEGDARVQLGLLLELELILEKGAQEAAKESSHAIMTVMIKLLGRSCSRPVCSHEDLHVSCVQSMT
jgi:hypothetical protein